MNTGAGWLLIAGTDKKKNHLPQVGERVVSNRNIACSRASKATVLRPSCTTREHTRALKGGNQNPRCKPYCEQNSTKPHFGCAVAELMPELRVSNSSEVTAVKRSLPAAVSLLFPRTHRQRTLLGSIFTAGQQLPEHLPAPSRPWLPSTAFDWLPRVLAA